MDRIIRASSNEGDSVLDPFCGCGTTIAAAQRLHRRWIGIDITARAIDIIVDRLRQDHGPSIDATYEIHQYPHSVPDAKRLAKDNPFHFQRWALEKLGVKPSDIKPGAARGIDGKLCFADGESGRTKRVVLSVKGGQHVRPRDVRELRGVLDRNAFDIGVLVSAEKPSKEALTDLASGRKDYETLDGRRYPRLQSLTVADIFAGKGVVFPGADELRRTIAPPASGDQFEALRFDFEAVPKRSKLPVKVAKSAKVATLKPPVNRRAVRHK
jgi:hypothetical protein